MNAAGTERPAFIALNAAGFEMALRLKSAVPAAEIWGWRPRLPQAERVFTDTGACLRDLFRAGRPIVGICASGILVRGLAPLLDDKTAEPPVLAVAADGSAVVPLLGGHHGANELARRIGAALGIAPALTTGTKAPLDEPPPGWRIGNPDAAKAVRAAILAGQPVACVGDGPRPDWLAHDAAGAPRILIGDAIVAPGETRLVLHPAVLAVGIGGERGIDADELRALAFDALASQDLAPGAIACLVSLEVKEDEAAFAALAGELAVPLRLFDAERLERETPRLANPSDVVFRAVGCHGVAEAAALAAAGPGGELIVPKRKSRRATVAIARAPAIIDPNAIGRAAGRLTVVGLGPGAPAWRSAAAVRAIEQAEAIVGYRGYLDLIADLAPGVARHGFALGQETERVEAALAMAAEGRRVALVSSGDPGVYAMASLVFERIEAGEARLRRLAVAVEPGISAMQAAAARAGAPLGHDFAAISLSDLLTPWPVIERRLGAALAADFAIALYNPASRSRRAGLDRALALIRETRAPTTPVVVARALGRPGEAVETVALADLAPRRIDMLSLLLIGASGTRLIERPGRGPVCYTPRGYDTAPR